MQLRWRQRARNLRWPVGVGVAWWYLRGSRAVARQGLSVEQDTGIEPAPRRFGARLQDAGRGVGSWYRRRYGAHAEPLTRLLAAALAEGFAVAAHLRRGRPIHPRGLVLDATLKLHGTSRFWGVPFLDEPAEARGVARMSRSAGLPPPLPDVLGIAVRWHPPERAGRAGAEGEPGRDGDAELLLATTGAGALGRRLLRPATRWAPAFYGSLLPYGAGDRKVFLGAVAERGRSVAADTESLARAVAEHPLRLDLVVATGSGRWKRFGELLLAEPAYRDGEGGREPVRFNPARRTIPGLRPVGLLQRVRGPSYAAAQRVPVRSGAAPRLAVRTGDPVR